MELMWPTIFTQPIWMCYSYYSLAQVDHTTVVTSIRHNIHSNAFLLRWIFISIRFYVFNFSWNGFSSSTIPSRIVLCRRIRVEEKVSCLLHSNTLLLEWEMIRFAATKHELHDILLEIQKMKKIHLDIYVFECLLLQTMHKNWFRNMVKWDRERNALKYI